MGLVAGYTGRAREGQTGCEATEWVVGDIDEVPGRGGRGTRRVVMTAGERGGSVTQAWSADMGRMSVMVDGRTGRGRVGASVTVHGAGMGLVTYTGRAREGQTGCEATEWGIGHVGEVHGRAWELRGTRRVVMTAQGMQSGSVT